MNVGKVHRGCGRPHGEVHGERCTAVDLSSTYWVAKKCRDAGRCLGANRRSREAGGGTMTCSQCGKRWSARACGPTHATVFAWMEVERKRIRRRAGYGLRATREWLDWLMDNPANMRAAVAGMRQTIDVIDAATRAPRKGRAR